MSEYKLNLVDINKDVDISGIETPFNFKLDIFQKYAIKAIYNNENVLVCAKTGSGKTLVGEFQIYNSLKKGKRVFYTTPIKSLSNQKFHDLKKIYGNEKVGIITGDIKFQPQADILIMTTEILRNLLYKEKSNTNEYGITAGISLEGLDAVIFDEVHYINDPDRGKVWEETLILLNREINLVLLSATIGNAESLAEWLMNIKKKTINFISTKYRIVPLTYYVLDNNYDFVEIANSKGDYNQVNYSKWIKEKLNNLDDYDKFKNRVKNREEGQVISDNKIHLDSPTHKINRCIETLKNKELLPVLFFIFSRKDCEKYAKSVECSLIDSSDSAAVKHIIDFHLHKYNDMLKHLEQYHQLRDLLLRGIAYHHSGLIPILKEIIEILFSKGYIKVLFATETFAVGINMPTKTVVFLDYKKYDEQKQGMRILRHDEYLQMAGRAGRRGIDDKGVVIYFPINKFVSQEENKLIMNGNITDLESRMDFHYDFILKLIHSKKYNYADIIENSYYQKCVNDYVHNLNLNITSNFQKQQDLKLEPFLKDLNEKRELDLRNKDSLKTKEIQTKINQWQNKHIGPNWNNASKKYPEWVNYQKNIDKCQNEIDVLKNKNNIKLNLEYLFNLGFIDENDNLTQKGILATEINETNPILTIEMYNQGFFKNLNPKELIQVISMFQDCKDDDVEIHTLNEIYSELKNLRDEFYKLELVVSNESFWNLTNRYIEPIGKWIDGELSESICRNYDIFPGNLYRLILSISSSVEELITISTISEDVDMLEKLNEIKPLLIKDIAISDSLYLKI